MVEIIGVENFRVFKNYTEFELRPLTLLTGPNNSGKSSFTKLLLLLKNGLNSLNFHQGRHNLESFESVLNWENDSNKLRLRLTNNTRILDNDFLIELIYENNTPKQLEVLNNMGSLIVAKFEKEKTRNFETVINRPYLNTSLNLELLIKIIKEKKICVWHTYKEKDGIRSRYIPLYKVDRSQDKTKTVNLSKLKTKYDELYEQHDHGNLDLVRNLALHNEIDQLDDSNLLFELFLNGKNATSFYINELLEIQKEAYTNYKRFYNIGEDYDHNDMLSTLSVGLTKIHTSATLKIKRYFEENTDAEKVELKATSLCRLIFDEKIFEDNWQENQYYQGTIFEQLKDIKISNKGAFDDLEFISANRGSHRRVLHNSSSSDIDKIILEYSKLKDKNLPFLKEILGILGIEGELIVERFQNYISVVSIKIGDKKIPLSDLGYGYSQILPIILKIITDVPEPQTFMGIPMPLMAHKTYILEEPEANLHPNLQSRLADILVKIQKYYPDVKFIIETHSEYLIRRLQYLTAKQELSDNDTVIYYFNADKYVSLQEPKVKKIEITRTGNLTDNFGPGFYDEATRLQFDLLKINQEQNN